jgi:hypothetical protein
MKWTALNGGPFLDMCECLCQWPEGRIGYIVCLCRAPPRACISVLLQKLPRVVQGCATLHNLAQPRATPIQKNLLRVANFVETAFWAALDSTQRGRGW